MAAKWRSNQKARARAHRFEGRKAGALEIEQRRAAGHAQHIEAFVAELMDERFDGIGEAAVGAIDRECVGVLGVESDLVKFVAH